MSRPESVATVIPGSEDSLRTTRPRKCPYCEQSFSKAEHLARHERSHTKEKLFQCGQCGKSYSRQ
ncbi:hypothetical protein CKAH01_00391 [Colletotrichum kahawae]|uniref:C2H2-type domain-containing protein n=1 Tax=Colletotrichum kahawae TaxID=34407 RepID=A0AAE0DED5_COLKA|nr:hypothetical protein CKAH01_00391 [Colletotrichum kahawae]